MLPTILSILLSASPGVDSPGRKDAQALVATIEALQEPIEDFRCEFEGTVRFKGKGAEGKKLGEDGLFDSFSGVYIWKRGGDVHSDSLHRSGASGTIARETLVVRMRENQAEQYHRLNDAPLGYAVIQTPEDVKPVVNSILGRIFLIDKLKQDVAEDGLEFSVADDQIDGRPLKVLSLSFKDVPDSLHVRYWIDLRRSGHVVRQEFYQSGKDLEGWLDIKLAPFKVGDAEIWMPVSGNVVGYVYLVNNKVVMTKKEPTVLETIYVVDGTMEFNKHPGRNVFTIKHKPGTPISDNLRKLTYEFGQQKIDLRPTKVEAEKMLNEQVAKAEEQKRELVVADPSEGINWSSWMVGGFGVIALISSIALWMQRRGR